MPFNTEIPFNTPDTTNDQIPIEELNPNDQNPNLPNENPPE
jgi:hypothetical protein